MFGLVVRLTLEVAFATSILLTLLTYLTLNLLR